MEKHSYKTFPPSRVHGGPCRCVVFLLPAPPPLSASLLRCHPSCLATASGRQTLPCHVGRLWCWSVLMERALSLFVHLKRRLVTGRWAVCHTDTNTDIFTLNTSSSGFSCSRFNVSCLCGSLAAIDQESGYRSRWLTASYSIYCICVSV